MVSEKQLRQAFTKMLEWLDVRHDEGVNVGPDVKRIIGQMKALSRKYAQASPGRAVAAVEPNDLPSIRALRTRGARRLWDRLDPGLYARKVKGAYVARAAGCTLGAIVEFNSIDHMEALARHCKTPFPPRDYWPATPQPWGTRYGLSRNTDYLRGTMRHVPVDDDLTYTLLGMLIMEDHGLDFTTADVGQAWLKYLPMACTAEKVALDNLRAGVSWRRAGVKDNPYVEWIGADIRSDPWGYVAAGWPEKAAELAYRDAYISHRYGGIYGEMYFSAAIAAAFAVDDPLEACEIALSEIPAASRVYKGVRWALNTAAKVKDYRHGNQLVTEKFKGMSGVHTILNAALTIFGLALGGRDVTKVIGNTVAMGFDNDCTAATAGSIVGATVGFDGVPEHWYKPFRNKVRTYMKGREWFTITEVVSRFGALAAELWGGSKQWATEAQRTQRRHHS